MMDEVAETATPRIEALLKAAYRDHATLCERRGVLLRCGIGSEHLPDDIALMAFVLLGEHDRDEPMRQVRPRWSELQSKGLVCGASGDATAAELRLLAHALQHTGVVVDVWQRLHDVNPEEAREPPYGILRCVTRVRGLWGQLARLHFATRDVQHMLIEPDMIFGLQPALVAVETSGQVTGVFDFPIDNGAITISLLHRSGEVYRHVVETIVGEVA